MEAGSSLKVNIRVLTAFASLLAGSLIIVLGTALLADYPEVRKIILGTELVWKDKQEVVLLRVPYPFTIQNLMWLMFFVGCGEIWSRMHQTNRDLEPVNARLLPEDRETMLRAKDLGPIYRSVNEGGYAEDAFLPRLINRTILQFQSSRSVGQANALLNSTLDLCQHEVELRYNVLRYLVWLIPTLGFIGTVLGIALALHAAGTVDFNDTEKMQNMMPTLTSNLGVAFYTTLLALIQSAMLVMALHIVQAREERALNRAGQYCLDNLINRLWDK